MTNAPGGIYANGNVTVAVTPCITKPAATGYTSTMGRRLFETLCLTMPTVSTAMAAKVRENRVYHNNSHGNCGRRFSTLAQNIVYSNTTGISGAFAYAGLLSGNIIYANSTVGVSLGQAGYYGGNATLLNNTIVQPQGDGLRIYQGSTRVNLRNNLLDRCRLCDDDHTDSQTGFTSDYNDFHLTGTAKLAQWQNVDRNTLTQWRTTAFTDTNSQSADPKFVDMDGADNVLGYVSRAADGRDDDFHLQSLYGSFKGIAFAPVASGDGTALPVFMTNPGNRQSMPPVHRLSIAGLPQIASQPNQHPTAALSMSVLMEEPVKRRSVRALRHSDLA